MLIKNLKNITYNFFKLNLNNFLSNHQLIRCLNKFSSRQIDINTIPSNYDNKIYKDILNQKDAFEVEKLINIEELFNCRCHLGHKIGLLNEHMKPYLFGYRQGLTIIDLNKTADHLKLALNFCAHIAFRKGIILFINPSKETAHITEKTAIECDEYSNCRNFKPELFLFPEKYYKTSIRLPDIIILIRTHENNFEISPAIATASQLLIPTIAIVDTDVDPRSITYPVPGNDDTDTSVALFCRLFKEAILLGKKKRLELFPTSNNK